MAKNDWSRAMLLIYTILYSTFTNLVADTKLKRSFIYDPFLYFLSLKMSEYNITVRKLNILVVLSEVDPNLRGLTN